MILKEFPICVYLSLLRKVSLRALFSDAQKTRQRDSQLLVFQDNLDSKMYIFEKSDENTEAGTMDDGRRPMGARAWHASFHAAKEA